MLLKALYDFAVTRELLKDPAFRRETPVRWIIHIDYSGKLVGLGPQETLGHRKNKGNEYDVPKTTRATNSGTVADFLVDDIGAIFCLASDLGTKLKPAAVTKLAAKHLDFWQQIRAALTATSDLRLAALLKFHAALRNDAPSFLTPDTKGSGWTVTTSSGTQVPLGNDMLTFAVDTPLFLDGSLREYWREIHRQETLTTEKSAKKGTCLITGQSNVALARTHTPLVTGLPKPAQSLGAGIVGADKSAFWSYGLQKASSENKENGKNQKDKNPGYLAPSSILASNAYLLALQHLSRRKDHWISNGSTWFCFWAVQNKEAASVFAELLRRPNSATVQKFFESPWSGLEKAPPDTDEFIATTLTAAGPRIVIKSWFQIPLITAVKNFENWFADLKIETGMGESTERAEREEKYPTLAIKQLALCTAPLIKKGGRMYADEEKLRSEINIQLYHAALEGSPPSVTLIKPLLDQLQSRIFRDENYRIIWDQSRFALLKLILNRNRNKHTMEIKPVLTTKTDDPAYNCGRLLSVLAATQDKAHEFKLEGPGVAERYFGTASISPSSVLPLLLRLNRHHLRKISKSERYSGHERFIEEQIKDVLVLFKSKQPGHPPSFPRTLDLQAQGRFALGFYQQSAADSAARKTKTTGSTENP